MELSCIHKNIKFDLTSTAYTQLVKDDRTLCVICHVEEPQDVCWDRYVLRCGHKYHTRCFRTWCGSKGKVNCPQCGDVQQIPQNRYCSGCDVWGHCGFIDNYNIYCKKRKSAVKMKTKKRTPQSAV